MRAQAQDDIEEHHRRLGVAGFLKDTRASGRGVNHGVGFSPREEIVAHIHD